MENHCGSLSQMRPSRGKDEFCSKSEKQRSFGGEDGIEGDVSPKEWSKGNVGAGGIPGRDTRPKDVIWGRGSWGIQWER